MNTIQSSTSTHPYAATTAYYLSFIILGLTTAASGPSLLKLAEHTSSPLDRISLIFVFGSFGYLIGSYFGGRAYDRVSGHKLMAFTMLIIGVSSAAIPIARSLEVLLLATFVSGLASGILDVGSNTLLLWTYGEKTGPFMNGLHFFFGVGALISPILLAQVLLKTGDIQWLYWTFAVVSMPIMIWLWFLPEPKHVHSEEGISSAFPVVPVILMMLLFILYVGLELGFGNWIYTYALALGLETEITSAYLTSAFWGSFTFGRLVGIWVSTRLRSRVILFMDIIGCAVSTLLVMLMKESSLALWIGTFGLGISMASIFPTLLMLAGERMRITGTVTGWFLVGSGVGSMFLPWLIGQIFARTGSEAMTTVLLVDILGLLFFLLFFLSRQVERFPDPVTSINSTKN